MHKQSYIRRQGGGITNREFVPEGNANAMGVSAVKRREEGKAQENKTKMKKKDTKLQMNPKGYTSKCLLACTTRSTMPAR